MKRDVDKLMEDLLDNAKRLIEQNDGRLITRDFFRANSRFKDRWRVCFNTFAEFMDAATLPPEPEVSSESPQETPLEHTVKNLEHRVKNHEMVIVAQAKEIRMLKTAINRMKYGTGLVVFNDWEDPEVPASVPVPSMAKCLEGL